MSNDRNEEEGLSHDELLAILTGKCPHEIQLQRAMGMLGAVAARQGGSMTVTHEELMALTGRALKIEGFDGGFHVSVMDPQSETPKQPTHPAPPTRQ